MLLYYTTIIQQKYNNNILYIHIYDKNIFKGENTKNYIL